MRAELEDTAAAVGLAVALHAGDLGEDQLADLLAAVSRPGRGSGAFRRGGSWPPTELSSPSFDPEVWQVEGWEVKVGSGWLHDAPAELLDEIRPWAKGSSVMMLIRAAAHAPVGGPVGGGSVFTGSESAAVGVLSLCRWLGRFLAGLQDPYRDEASLFFVNFRPQSGQTRPPASGRVAVPSLAEGLRRFCETVEGCLGGKGGSTCEWAMLSCHRRADVGVADEEN
jgi:hypothetical protein